MSNKTTADHEIRKVLEHKADPDIRVTRSIQIGHAIHQGDVYVHAVSADHPRGKALGTRQVAVGTTIGARHVVKGDGVTVFEGKKLPSYLKVRVGFSEADYLGPVVVADGQFVLTHPEHAHHAMPAGVYQVTYQVDESTRMRVED